MLERLSQWFHSPRRFALALGAWFVCLAWFRPPTVPDEGRYTDIARWMLLTGDWIIPRLNGLPFIQKPPLFFWLDAIGLAVAGNHLIVYRWSSLAAAMLSTFVVYRFVRARFDVQAARWSAIVLAASPFFFAVAQFASLDMLVSTGITCTILFAIEAVETAEREPGARAVRWAWLAAYAAAAFGVLAKGLIGAVLPGLVFVLWALMTRRPRALLAALRLDGLVLFALITAPWFLLVEQRIPGFLRYFFIHNHFERYAAGGFNNPKSAWFYVGLILGGTLPWALALWHAGRAALTRTDAARDTLRLGLLWALVVFVFFAIPQSKLAGYVLPCVPGLALALGPWFAQFKHRRLVLVIALVLCVAPLPFAIQAQNLNPGRLAVDLRSQVAAQDRVVMWRRYFFSVPLLLDRQSAVEVVDTWDKPSAELPDSWRRELAAGREFEPARAEGVLLTREQFAASLNAQPQRTVWVWVFHVDAKDPELAGLEKVAERGEYLVLRRPGR
jgi:4-amino-4-deoxy-L-arabinose transferase-like glycosyltransferase